MGRNVTVTFSDGTTHTYQNAPDDITPDAVQSRAEKEFNKSVTALDGGKSQAIMAPRVDVGAPATEDAIPQRSMMQNIAYPVLETVLPVAGGIIGGAGGVFGGPVGSTVGAVTGASLAYGGAKEIEKMWENIAGQRKQEKLSKEAIDATKNVLEGATYDMGGRLILAPVAKAAGWIYDAVTGKLAQVKAGKIVRELAGPKVDEIKQVLKTAPEDLTGAQAIANVEAAPLQTLGQRATEKAPYTFRPIEQAQQAGRTAALEKVTPFKPVAEEVRTAITEPLYKAAAETVIPVDTEIKAVLNRLPAGTIEKAKELARLEGRPFIYAETIPGAETATRVSGTPQISGESLHYIKRALSDIANAADATKGIGRDTQAAARKVLNDYLSVVETKLPSYGEARQTFAKMSEPVNQSMVLNKLREVIQGPAGEEKVNAFLNVLGKGEQALLKKATGFARYETGDLGKVLTEEQLSTVNKIADDLVRNTKMAEQAKAGLTAYEDALRKSGGKLRLPNFLSVKATVTNKTLDLLEDKLDKKVMNTLVESMKSGKTLYELLDTLPAADRLKVLSTIKNDPQVQQAIGYSINALAVQPELRSRNALTGTMQ